MYNNLKSIKWSIVTNCTNKISMSGKGFANLKLLQEVAVDVTV